MGFEMTRETTIDAPRERVWAYLAEFARHTEWADPTHNFRIQLPRGVRPGATFTSVGRDMGRDAKNAVTITEVVPGSRIVYDALMDNRSLWRNVLALSDAGRSTRLVKSASFVSAKFPFNVLGAILGPLTKAEGAKVLDGDLQRIKARVEGTSPRT